MKNIFNDFNDENKDILDKLFKQRENEIYNIRKKEKKSLHNIIKNIMIYLFLLIIIQMDLLKLEIIYKVALQNI